MNPIRITLPKTVGKDAFFDKKGRPICSIGHIISIVGSKYYKNDYLATEDALASKIVAYGYEYWDVRYQIDQAVFENDEAESDDTRAKVLRTFVEKFPKAFVITDRTINAASSVHVPFKGGVGQSSNKSSKRGKKNKRNKKQKSQR